MGHVATVFKDSNKDKVAARMIASLSDGVNALATPGRYCQFACRPSGEQIGYGYISMPISSLADEYAPTVALRASGPAGKVKLGTRASLGYSEGANYIPLINGTLVSFVHDFGEDSALGIVFDDRFLMTKVTCFGRMIYDPIEMTHYFDPNQALIFNELGWPSCLDTPFGPRFAPAYRYGYRSQFGAREDLTEPLPGSATIRARSWTCSDILNYLRDAHYSGEGNHRPADVKYYGNHFLGESISWPKAASNIVGNTRSVNHFVVQNDSLLIGLQKTCRKAGAYDLLVKPQGSNKSVISFVNMGPRDREGSYLYTPDYLSEGELLTSNNAIHSGYIREDIANYFDETVIIGDAVSVERMLSTASAGTGASGIEAAWDRGGGSLQSDFSTAAATNSDEGNFLKYLKDNGKNEEAFIAARKTWPLVFCAYRIQKGYRLWKGTKYEDRQNQGAHASMRPVLLTGSQENSSNPANWLPREVTVEFDKNKPRNPDSDTSWSPCQRYDNLTLSPDGQILYVSALADQVPAQTWVSSAGQYDPDFILPCDIRMTIAANSDWALTGLAQTDPNNTKRRVKTGLGFSYQVVAEVGDYVEFLRGGGGDKSYPNGKAKISASQADFPDRCTSGNELFSDLADDGGGNPGRLPRHAAVRQSDVRRIANSGQIIQAKLNPAIEPGMAISIESGDPIKTNSVVKSVSWDGNTQMTTIELQAADQSVIYDLPMPAGYQDVSPASGGQGGNTPGYLNQDSYDYGSTSGNSKPEDRSPSDVEGSGAGKVNDIDDEPRRGASRGAQRDPDGNSGAEDPAGEKKSTIRLDGQDFKSVKQGKGIFTPDGRFEAPETPTPGIRQDGKAHVPDKTGNNTMNGEGLPTLSPREKGVYTPEGRVSLPSRHDQASANVPTPSITKSLPQRTRAQNIKDLEESD